MPTHQRLDSKAADVLTYLTQFPGSTVSQLVSALKLTPYHVQSELNVLMTFDKVKVRSAEVGSKGGRPKLLYFVQGYLPEIEEIVRDISPDHGLIAYPVLSDRSGQSVQIDDVVKAWVENGFSARSNERAVNQFFESGLKFLVLKSALDAGQDVTNDQIQSVRESLNDSIGKLRPLLDWLYQFYNLDIWNVRNLASLDASPTDRSVVAEWWSELLRSRDRFVTNESEDQ